MAMTKSDKRLLKQLILKGMDNDYIERRVFCAKSTLQKYRRALETPNPRVCHAHTDKQAKCVCAEGTSHTVCTSFKEDKYRPGYCGNPDPSDTPSGRIRNICNHPRVCHAPTEQQQSG